MFQNAGYSIGSRFYLKGTLNFDDVMRCPPHPSYKLLAKETKLDWTLKSFVPCCRLQMFDLENMQVLRKAPQWVPVLNIITQAQALSSSCTSLSGGKWQSCSKLLQLGILWHLQTVWPLDTQPVNVSDPAETATRFGLSWLKTVNHSPPFSSDYSSSSAEHKNAWLFVWPCSLTSFLFPAAVYPFSHRHPQPWCVPSITIHDPHMTLRDSCYLRHMHSSFSRQCYRLGREGWSEEMERQRSTRLTSSFLLLCPCIMHGTAVHISRAFWTRCIYKHTQAGTFSFPSTALYGVGECMCLSVCVSRWYAVCWLVWVAPWSTDWAKGENWGAGKIMQPYSRDGKEGERK